MRYTLIIPVLLSLPVILPAQDNLGIAGSSYSPVNTVMINPASIVDSRAFIDFNLVGAGAFLRNTLAYIPGDQFSLSALSNLQEPAYNRGNHPYHLYSDDILQGPSATFAVRQNAFGFHSAVRAVADARGVTEELGYFITEGINYEPQIGKVYTVKELRTNALAWMELGASYGTIIGRNGNQITLGGITINKLVGIGGAGVRIDEWRFMVTDSSSLETYTIRGEYGYNIPEFNSGRGWSCDLGITVKKLKRSAEGYTPHSPCTDGDFVYRYGISAVDLGTIRFRGEFYRNVFNETDQSEWNDFSNTTADEGEELDSLINAGFQMSQSNSDQEKFNMKLPGGISGQLDLNMGHHMYLYGSVMFGIPWKNSLGVQRASYLGLAPRYEIKRFEASLPLTLYEFRHPQIGFMLRLNSLIIGSDNLGSLLFKQDAYGADFYLNLKYTIFKHWKCRDKKARSEPKQSQEGKWVPCPTW